MYKQKQQQQNRLLVFMNIDLNTLLVIILVNQ